MSLAEDLQLATLAGPARALAEEACRIKARLDKLEAIITGDDDSWLTVTEVAGDLEVTINRPLAEARQQALALRAVLAELRAVQGVQPAESAAPVADPADDLAAARERKRKEAVGQS